MNRPRVIIRNYGDSGEVEQAINDSLIDVAHVDAVESDRILIASSEEDIDFGKADDFEWIKSCLKCIFEQYKLGEIFIELERLG
jgi:hypothetical protein